MELEPQGDLFLTFTADEGMQDRCFGNPFVCVMTLRASSRAAKYNKGIAGSAFMTDGTSSSSRINVTAAETEEVGRHLVALISRRENHLPHVADTSRCWGNYAVQGTIGDAPFYFTASQAACGFEPGETRDLFLALLATLRDIFPKPRPSVGWLDRE